MHNHHEICANDEIPYQIMLYCTHYPTWLLYLAMDYQS